MRLIATRDVFTRTTTLSRLAVHYDGPLAYGPGGWSPSATRGPLDFGYVLEDEDRGLLRSWGEARCAAAKVARETAIPATEGGEDYRVVLTWSNRYHDRLGADGAMLCADGRMMLLEAVPAFRGVRCHPGTGEDDTDACVLPGLSRDPRRAILGSSTKAYRWLDARVRECEARGEEVRLAIRREPIAWAAFRAAHPDLVAR